MSDLTLTISAATSALTGALYFYVGRQLQRREVAGEAVLAHYLFVIWWKVLGASAVLSAAQIVLYLAEWLPLPLYIAISRTNLLLIVIGLWGLLYYLWFLYTGSRNAWRPLASFYVIFYGVLAGLLAWVGTPETISDDGWSLTQVPQPDLPVYVGLLFLVGLVGPQIGAAIAYLGLIRKAETRTQRYRIGMVSGAIIGWFGASLVASFIQISDAAWWPLTSRAISVLAALAVLFAYHPPGWMQRRFHLDPVAAQPPSPADDPQPPAPRQGEEE